MSVEDAREALERAINDYASECASDDDCIVRCAVEPYAAIDRLILEVQAEMPCYWQKGVEGRKPCAKDEQIWSPRNSVCPSCTARMKLKETADAR